MAHFARVDENNIVQEVIVVNNDVIMNDEGVEQESLGQEFIASLGIEGTWLQCSYNGSMRGIFPSLHFSYNAEADVFLPPVYYSVEE